MLRSAVVRRVSTAAIPRGHRILSSLFFSTDAAADQPQVRPPRPPPHPEPSIDREAEAASEARARAAARASAAAADEAAEELRRMKKSRVKATDYEEEQERVLRAALQHVLRLGWSESALIAGARDASVSPAIVGAFPKKEAALVEFFMDDCLQRLIDRIDSGEELGDLILSERLAKLIHIRLEMQAPYISKWPQALSIQAQPMNLSTSFKQRAMLVDEFWHAAGEQGSDIDWYVKRTVLGGIYSTSEIFMLTDVSPDFRDTWSFVDRRVKDAFDLQKTVQEATYLAEAVGAGMSTSVQGFVKRLFQGGQ